MSSNSTFVNPNTFHELERERVRELEHEALVSTNSFDGHSKSFLVGDQSHATSMAYVQDILIGF